MAVVPFLPANQTTTAPGQSYPSTRASEGAIDLVTKTLCPGLIEQYGWIDPEQPGRTFQTFIVEEVARLHEFAGVPASHIEIAAELIIELTGRQDVYDTLVNDFRNRQNATVQRQILSTLSVRLDFLESLPKVANLEAADLKVVYFGRPALQQLPAELEQQAQQAAAPASQAKGRKRKAATTATAGSEEQTAAKKTKRAARDPKPKDDNETEDELALFGAVEGIQVGKAWSARKEIVDARMHCRPQGSVHGTKKRGVYSIIIAGGYREDRNHGTTIHFTGVGGTTNGGNKRVAPNSRLSVEDLTEGPNPINTENTAMGASLASQRPVRIMAGAGSGLTFCKHKQGFVYIGLWKVTGSHIYRNERGIDVLTWELDPYDAATMEFVGGEGE
ncbi:hypothetical protein TWF730_000300 [Orbilia blumenaviensis]|uniref:YDG domain-containing protein n=1 Tax=Orbilia blumenaviensis TaxID=1796055 RepID=A0AAV9VLF9_9PEZI